jgi:hypothetical protein
MPPAPRWFAAISAVAVRSMPQVLRARGEAQPVAAADDARTARLP